MWGAKLIIKLNKINLCLHTRNIANYIVCVKACAFLVWNAKIQKVKERNW